MWHQIIEKARENLSQSHYRHGAMIRRFLPVTLYKSLFTENTVASKEEKTQQRKHKYNSNKVHDSR